MNLRIIATKLFLMITVALAAQEIVETAVLPGGYQLTLTEEVRFGAVEEDEAYQWPSLQTKVLPAPNGQMYIFDHEGSRVLLFGRDGVFVKQVARGGQGPGELQYMTSISQTPSGLIYIMDTPSPGNLMRIKRYHADMTFRDEISTLDMPLRPDSLYVSHDEKNMAGLFVTFDPKTKGLSVKTGVLRLADKAMLNVFSVDQTALGLESITDQNKWVEIITRGVKQQHRAGLLAMADDGTVYTANADKYVISQWEPGEKVARRVISRNVKPRPFTDRDKEALVDHQWENMNESSRAAIARASIVKGLDKAELPAHPPLVGLISMEDKGFLAIRQSDAQTRINRADVFSKKGELLCEIELSDAALSLRTPGSWTPNKRMVFRNGMAYTILTDDEGDNIAVRYSYALTKQN